MECRSAVLAAVVLFASSASATTTIPVTFDAAVDSGGRLEVRVTAHNEFVNRGVVEIRQGDVVERFAASLPLEVAMSFSTQVRAGIDEVRVAYYRENGVLAGSTAVFVDRAGGGWRLVPAQERARQKAEAALNAAARNGEALARKHVAAILARGGHPVAVEENLDHPYVAAWNRVVAEMVPAKRGASRRAVPAAGDCSPYLLSDNNYTYPLRGSVGYIDRLYPYDRYFKLSEPGYPVTVVVQQETIDQCGNTSWRYHWYNATTDFGGNFYLPSITTWEPFGGYNPVSSFRTTTPDAGLRNGNSMDPYTHVMDGSYSGFYWGSSEGIIEPYWYTDTTPYPFLFRWNEEIKREQRLWNAYGFGSYFTPFRAAYEGPGGVGARFWPVSPGMTVFDSVASWSNGYVMAHENGHHFQFRLQGDYMQGSGPVHTICAVLPEKDAFIEGFADWYGVYWNDEGRENVGITCDGGECFSTCAVGYQKEGNVMAYFWDVFDTANHGTYDQGIDNVFYPLNILMNWRATGDYENFPDWYDDFYWKGVWNGNEATMDNLRVVNKVDVPQ